MHLINSHACKKWHFSRFIRSYSIFFCHNSCALIQYLLYSTVVFKGTQWFGNPKMDLTLCFSAGSAFWPNGFGLCAVSFVCLLRSEMPTTSLRSPRRYRPRWRRNAAFSGSIPVGGNDFEFPGRSSAVWRTFWSWTSSVDLRSGSNWDPTGGKVKLKVGHGNQHFKNWFSWSPSSSSSTLFKMITDCLLGDLFWLLDHFTAVALFSCRASVRSLETGVDCFASF